MSELRRRAKGAIGPRHRYIVGTSHRRAQVGRRARAGALKHDFSLRTPLSLRRATSVPYPPGQSMAMPNASTPPGATPLRSFPSPVTLRSLLDARRCEGRRMSLAEAIAVIVPVCLDLQERHARGERLLVHPSSIAPGADGIARPDPSLTQPPTHVFDRHCLAPELRRTLEPGDACASVYSVGAILYEMLTGYHVGPGMQRPREIDPPLPEALEVLIGKAIIGERAHRPADLGALASALYHVAPQKSIHPPDISEARLDASAELAVDVRFSMLPPSTVAPAALEASSVTSIPRAPLIPRLKARISSRAPRAVDRRSNAPDGAPNSWPRPPHVRARPSP